MKRRLFKVRVRFHDWMWQHHNPVALLARRLPLYFSDPHAPSKEWMRGFETGSKLATANQPTISYTTNASPQTFASVSSYKWGNTPDQPRETP